MLPERLVADGAVKERLTQGVGDLSSHLASLYEVFFASADQVSSPFDVFHTQAQVNLNGVQAKEWERAAAVIQSMVRRGLVFKRYKRMNRAVYGLKMLFSK